MIKQLHAPWRDTYAKQDSSAKSNDSTQCPFCIESQSHNDDENFILNRFTYTYVVLNRYPYNAGHLLILPFKHIPTLESLHKSARAELIEVINISCNLLTTFLQAPGINLGANIGMAAGAGIPSHFHMHALPRWPGDTNFMPVLGETKVISFDLNTIFNKLKPEFKKISI